MNDRKLTDLFTAAGRDQPPAPPEGFVFQVLQALPRESARSSASLRASLEVLFPRVALVAISLLVLCAATDLGYGWASGQSLSEGVDQLCDSWMFTTLGT